MSNYKTNYSDNTYFENDVEKGGQRFSICSSCGRWSTNKQHCYDAIITLLCIKRYTNVFDNLDNNVVKIIANLLLQNADDPQWQHACATAKWMNLV